jgi:hypothetical protein
MTGPWEWSKLECGSYCPCVHGNYLPRTAPGLSYLQRHSRTEDLKVRDEKESRSSEQIYVVLERCRGYLQKMGWPYEPVLDRRARD